MNKLPSILFSLCGDHNKASSRVRGYWVSKELQKIGFSVTHFRVTSKADYIRFTASILKHDIIIFQKTYSRYDPYMVRFARLLGKRCYFDIDDAPSRTQKSVARKNAARMMRLTNGVFAGSRELAKLAKVDQPKTHLIPSGILLENYKVLAQKPDKPDTPICLGWIGNGAHYVDDLISILAEPLRELASRHSIKFRIIGACEVSKLTEVFGAIHGLEIDFIDQIDWSSPDAVSSAIAPFDIGLYPLKKNAFNRFKCGFKALEYMASGIPVVASAVPGNTDIIQSGKNGYLVTSKLDWINTIEELIADNDLRRQIGVQGRKHVELNYSTEKIASDVALIITSPSIVSHI